MTIPETRNGPVVRSLAIVLLVTAAGCATRVESAGPASTNQTDPEVAGTLVIDQFLRAVNTADIDRMAQLFGTAEAPFARLYPRDQVETRMLLIANILKHQNYEVVRMGPVAGRRGAAVTADVRMTVGAKTVDVPYVLVWSQGGRWLIESIDLEKITGGGPDN